ncbi:MAG: DegT/DnrJ/EryC1/StrS family aminotransferase [Candidatus Thorarchaeota archaeon]|jgi:dTDP-4-amino-4,6-dideoxygalactose transaminase
MGYDYKVRFVNYRRHYTTYKDEFDAAISDIVENGDFILRQHLDDFEEHLADFIGVKYAVGVNSGTDALFFALKALGIGQGNEVITVSHTFLATVGAIVNNGGVPKLIDVGSDHNMDTSLLRDAITPKTKALLPVHLNGRICNMKEVMDVANEHGIQVIEDAAQALGATYAGINSGSYGAVSCFSFYPAKVLGTIGDGGALATDDENLARSFRELRDNGRTSTGGVNGYGYCSRLDNLHAAILDFKLRHIPEWIERRRKIAKMYHDAISDVPDLTLMAYDGGDFFDVFQNYVVMHPERDRFVKHLRESGVEVLISWPVPMHHHDSLNLDGYSLPMTERISNEVVSLPMYPDMNDEEVEFVIEAVKKFK